MASKRSLGSAFGCEPAIDSKRQKTQSNSIEFERCPEEPHTCQQPTFGKKQWRAVWGGPNPGIHFTSWEVLQPWVERVRHVHHKNFKTNVDAAKAWYATTKSAQQQLQQRKGDEHPIATAAAESSQCNDQPAPPAYGLTLSRSDLCQEQIDLIHLIVNGHGNVFYTGSAGAGKSTVLNEIRKQFKALGKKVAVVAPTGRAALEVYGQTIWTYAGLKPYHLTQPFDSVVATISSNSWVKSRMRSTEVLVIDEISMVDSPMFDRVNAIMKAARGSSRPFGGVKLVVTGDFCQLPPVLPFEYCRQCGKYIFSRKLVNQYCVRCNLTFYSTSQWAFASQTWEDCKFKCVNLTNVHRQAEQVFIQILRKIRRGKKLSYAERNTLLHHDKETKYAVKLYPLVSSVDAYNDIQFRRLPGRTIVYHCVNHPEDNDNSSVEVLDAESKRKLKSTTKDHRYKEELKLKQGMPVILLANLNFSAGLVNGAQGTVVGFQKWEDGSRSPSSTTNSNLNPDYSVTGETDENGTAMESSASSDPYARLFYEAMGWYEGPSSMTANDMYCRARETEFLTQCKDREWPIVKFDNGFTTVIRAHCLTSGTDDFQGTGTTSRTQVPLMAGYAMTIHRAQGMTLNYVEVDLAGVFEKGQAYVALSRAKSLKGLSVLSFPEYVETIGCAQEVEEFLQATFPGSE